MTAHHTPPESPDDPFLVDAAASDAVGRRIQSLALEVEAPATLRMRLSDARREPGARGRRRRFAVPALGAVGLAAMAAVVLVLAGVGGGTGAPSVDDAVALALASPTAPAPAIDASNMQLVRAQVGGITFPNYSYAWPNWRTTGARQDRISGRAATTVVYHGPRGDVGYTIVDGKPLDEPDGARHVRDGHTCVLAGRGAGVEKQLVKFAAWA
jgi:hypothetical protein